MRRRAQNFFKTPKGLATIVLLLLIVMATRGQGVRAVFAGLASSTIAAGLIDMLILRVRKKVWEYPSGAVLTAIIVTMVLRAQEPWYITTITAVIGVLSKYIIRSRSANVFNPAALAIIASFYLFHTAQNWWGALTDVIPIAKIVLLGAGAFIVDRVNKMPLVLTFLAAYFMLFTVTSFVVNPLNVAEIFRTPDAEAALYFAFFILTDPPTSPAKYRDQLWFGVIVAVVSYALFELFGVVYYLLGGVLIGNVWEAWRRVHRRSGYSFPGGIGTFLLEIGPWKAPRKMRHTVSSRMLPAVVFLILLSGVAVRAEVAFSTDVWPVLERRCVGCHQPGEIAPMPLTSYAEVRPWANAIREAVLTRKMPPWHAAGETAHSFRNDRSLSEAEIQTIANWVKEGAREGEALKTAFHPANRDGGWKLGKPDIVIRVPGFRVPASGQMTYRYLITGGLFPRDVWVRAAEFRIDQRSVVHHINAYARGPESSYLAGYPKGEIVPATVADRGRRREGERVFDRRQQLIGWEPGYVAMPWLPGGAKQIRAGSDIVFEMHFSPNGKEVTDYSQFGLYLASGPPSERVVAIDTLRDLDLAIPAGEKDYVSRASMTLAQPVRLVSVQPHMHYRGKAMEVRVIYPDGRAELLISVPKYDFNWQTTYVLREPKLLPEGTKLESVARFDNSVNNPSNPDASVLVHWGDQTTDEMHIAFLELALPVGADPEKLFAAPPRMIGTPAAK